MHPVAELQSLLRRSILIPFRANKRARDENRGRNLKQIGGAERIRTAYPLVANEVLYQMSYDPTVIQ